MSAQEFAQRQLVSTPHPLQRVGAFALAGLAKQRVGRVEEVTAESFDTAMTRVTEDAAQAATKDSRSTDGFWQKVSLSFFPNSPMNHPGRYKGKNKQGSKRTDEDVRQAVREWHTRPDVARWPRVPCVLCGREAVGFYGKKDVPLGESESYRNVTPPGHEGMALCWPCLCCFYALPYGCHLTGGESIAVHSWDDRFLARTARRQVAANRAVAVVGHTEKSYATAREVVALRALRGYSAELTSGVELLVFNNNNRGQTLEFHELEQPVASWLQHTNSSPATKAGYSLLVRAHKTPSVPGVVGLARNAFHRPERIVSAAVRAMTACVSGPEPDVQAAAHVAGLVWSFATEVEQVKESELQELRSCAGNLAQLLAERKQLSGLKRLRTMLHQPSRLRRWLISEGVVWTARGGENEGPPASPLVSVEAFRLLFEPGDEERPTWLYRDLLVVAISEELCRLGWQPEKTDRDETLAEINAEETRQEQYDENDEEGAS